MPSISTRRRIVSRLLPLVAVLICSAVFAADAAPWLRSDAAEKYVFVGKTVWDVDSGKMIAPTGGVQFIENARPIAGVTDRIFSGGSNPGAPSMPGLGNLAMLGDEARKMPSLDDKPIPSIIDHPGFWAATDHRRVVWFQNGDLWRGEVDWPNVKIVNRKQVTTLGVFTPLNFPLLWYGNTLYVYGNFDKEKPIVRVDLVGGEVREMETYHAFLTDLQNHRAMSMVSPGGCRIAYPTRALIYSYDVRTDKPTMIRNKLEHERLANYGQQLFITMPAIWTDDDTFYSYFNGYLSRIDLRNARMDVLVKPPGLKRTNERIEGLVPGTHLIDISNNTGGGKEMTVAQTGRYLLDVTTGQRLPLPFDGNAHGKWLDDNYFIYTVDKGGLANIGTWVYDRAANSNKRMIATTIDYLRLAHLKGKKQLWAVSQQSGIRLVRINLDGSGSQVLGDCQLAQPFALPADNPIDLGFGGSTVDLWKPPVIDEKAVAATQPAEPPEGKLKLFELTKAMPKEDQAFAENAYDWTGTSDQLNSLCDPVKVAMKMLDIHKSRPQDPINNLSFQTDFSDCADRDRIAEWAQENAFRRGTAGQLTEDQRNAILDRVGPCVADTYFKQAKPDLKSLNGLLEQCVKDVNGQPVMASHTQGPANAPPQHPAGQGQTNPPANPPPQQNPVDKAAAEAQHAKDTANKLRGLFRH